MDSAELRCRVMAAPLGVWELGWGATEAGKRGLEGREGNAIVLVVLKIQYFMGAEFICLPG